MDHARDNRIPIVLQQRRLDAGYGEASRLVLTALVMAWAKAS